MKALGRLGLLSLWALLMWALVVFHRGVFPSPAPGELRARPEKFAAAKWIPRQRAGINQLVVTGTPYERGLAAGMLMRPLLYQEEKTLADQLGRFFPGFFLRNAFILGTIRWFWGIERYFESTVTEEMYGVAQSASHDFDYLLDPFTRQIAYHGLHEVGQWMVDRGGMDMGCTVFAVPYGSAWVVGRNFDFEGGRIFDEEKLLKWVFPEKGNAYVSVIWAGMVGVVTGVNEHGVYVSINAGGSSEYRRYGTPSTLVVLKALENASTAREAAAIIEKADTIITDIFVVADSREGRVLRVEKSPRQTHVTELKQASVITNHLQDPAWASDSVNLFRMRELTTVQRFERGQQLLKALDPEVKKDGRKLELAVLGMLRDKHGRDGKPLPLGNRQAVDALIATHSVIYNAADGLLYVSRGPSLSGPFIGYDLKESFRRKEPVVRGALPADSEVTDEVYYRVKKSFATIASAERAIERRRCEEGGRMLDQIEEPYRRSSAYYSARGNFLQCQGDGAGAVSAWKEALAQDPAYRQERLALEGKVKQ